jgi:phage-related protein (TIGR01555 family)
MAPRKKKSVTANSAPKTIMANNLSAAVGITMNPFSNILPQVQVSQLETVEKNLRYGLITNNYALLSRCYMEYGLCQSLIDTPVDDAFRGGIKIYTKQLDEEQVEKLSVAIDRNQDLRVASQACKWDRLYGGAGVIIVLSDQDPATPLDIKAIGKDSELKFQSCNLWELFFTQNSSGEWQMPESGEGAPLEESIESSAGFVNPEFYHYYSCKLHSSRLLKLIGVEPPSFLRGQLRGWGASMLESIIRPLNSFLKIDDLTFELLDECKIDVYKINNLNSSVISEGGTEQVRKRLTIANMQKNYQHAIALDTEDDFDYKNLSGSFAGIAEVAKENRIAMAGCLRMPQNKIWGQSATGFSSGQDDLENYAALVEGQVREKIRWHIQTMVELRCQQMYGMIPSDLKIEFESLRIMSSEQEEAVKTSKFARLMQARERNEISRYEFREACNKEKLLGVSLDLAGDELNPEDPQAKEIIEEPKEEEGDAPKSSASLKFPKAKGATANDKGDFGIEPYTKREIQTEKNAEVMGNSANFDRANYAAHGGDSWTRGRPSTLFEDYIDPELWEKAIKRSVEAYGKPKWEFAAWWYLKHGGKFVV